MAYGQPGYRWNHFCVLDLETFVPDADPDGGFPPWPHHEIVCASILQADLERYREWRFALSTVHFTHKEDALREVDELIGNRTVVSLGGRAFDAPVLGMAACQQQLFECRNIARFWSSPRFGPDHADLVELFGNYGATRGGCSMKELSRALDVPAKTMCDGSDVAAMVAAGELEAVGRYCDEDCAVVLALWAHWAALRQGDPAYHATLVSQFGEHVRDAGLNHLTEFLNPPHAEELLRCSVQAIATAGAQAIELREHLNFVDPGRRDRVVLPAFEDFDA